MTRSSRIALVAALATVGLITPVAAYPPGTALDVQIIGTSIRAAGQGSFNIRVINIQPGTPCYIYFNKRNERTTDTPPGCRTNNPATTMQYNRPTPMNVGKLRVIAYQPSQGQIDGRSDFTFAYVPGVKTTALAKNGRAQGFSVDFLPEDAVVTLCVFNGSASSSTPRSSFDCDTSAVASELGPDIYGVPRSDLSWTPAKSGIQSVRIYANDGNPDVLLWSKNFRVLK